MINRLKWITKYCDHCVELDYFYNQVLERAIELPEEYPFLEIGTREGGTALLSLNAINDSGKKKRTLFTVDPYGNKPYEGNSPDYNEDRRRIAMKVISDFCFEEKLNHNHFRLSSLQFYETWIRSNFWYNGELLPKKFGFIYFDGDHSDENVFKELSMFVPLIHPKGLYTIDDQSDETHYSKIIKGTPIVSYNRLFFDASVSTLVED